MHLSEDEIENLIKDFESKIKAKFNEFLKSAKSEKSLEIVKNFLLTGDIESAIKYIEDQWDIFIPLIFSLFLIAAEKEMRTLFSRSFTNLTNQSIQILINNFKNNLKYNDPIRDEVYRMLRNGATISEITDRISEIVGLNSRQLQAIDNYRKLLEDGNKAAFSRILRNESFDGRMGATLTQRQINQMVDSYRRNMTRFRAETIAQDQTLEIIDSAMEEAVRESGEVVEKEWRSRRDNRVRDTHKQHIGLDGKKVIGVDTYFVSPSGAKLRRPRDFSAPAFETRGCRCFLIYRTLK